MTTEIAIMNTQGVALAADSAATITNEKIQVDANKIFMLSKHHPVGAMIYGSADLLGIPWEVIIKIFRENLSKRSFPGLKEYANLFSDFVTKDLPNSVPFPKEAQDRYFLDSIHYHFKLILSDIRYRLEILLEQQPEVSVDDIQKISKETILYYLEIWKKSKIAISAPDWESVSKGLAHEFAQQLGEIMKSVFMDWPIDDQDKKNLIEISLNVPIKLPDPNSFPQYGCSGVVIAGYGDQEILPSLTEVHFCGIFKNNVKHAMADLSSITLQYPSRIIPFAQRDMIDAFMRGIDPNFSAAVLSDFRKLFLNYSALLVDQIQEIPENSRELYKVKFQKTAAKELENSKRILDGFSEQNFIGPVMSIVGLLSKTGLGEMAESLVNLASFKKKISPEAETVGGPIDVAVISKGDGFIWIKRKHYFKPELNFQFFSNYFKGGQNDAKAGD